ncbi:MAG: C39 family peptidase [Chloroflexi bacterium]|nr:C39 family peptidase [Chloroflexota bacterium]
MPEPAVGVRSTRGVGRRWSLRGLLERLAARDYGRRKAPGLIAAGVLLAGSGLALLVAVASSVALLWSQGADRSARGYSTPLPRPVMMAPLPSATPPLNAGLSSTPVPASAPTEPLRLAVTTVTPAQTAAKTPTSPATAGIARLITGVPAGKQARRLNCEFQSASDLAGFYGLEIGWEALFLKVGYDPNGDPNKGFVGLSMDGLPGGAFPEGYGVYAEPIARGLAELGLPARAFFNLDAAWLRREIDAGRPVIVWATYDMHHNSVDGWYTKDGKTWVMAVREEHTFMVVGYDGTDVYVNDPFDGQRKQYDWQTFLQSWTLLGNMAVTVRP